MLTVPPATEAGASTGYRLALESLIADLSTRFIDLPPARVDREIEDALRLVCEATEIDLAVLWQWTDARAEVITPTHSWCTDPSLRPTGPMRQEHYPWTRQEVLAGRAVVMASVRDLPAAATVDGETCRRLGIRAAVCLPLKVGGEPPLGALGFNALRAERPWPDDLVTRLRLVAQVLANALARRRRELALRQRAARLESGAELAGLGFYEVDLRAKVARVDDRFCRLCGLPPARRHGDGPLAFWLERLHPDDRPRVLELRRQLHAGELGSVSLEYRFLHPALGERWLHHLARVATRDADGHAIVTFGVLRDVTEHRHDALALRELGRRLLRAHEDERALLARELHDDVTQRLAVLAIDTSRAERDATDPAVADAMRGVREGLVRLSEDVHALAYRLHPAVLSELGLAEALRAECERWSRRSAMAVVADLGTLPEALDRDAALCLFRVAQESLGNVARHARADAVLVRLHPARGGLLLEVRDDGCGFDPAVPGDSKRLGLVSIRERVHLARGTIDIESAPGAGTTVVAWVPVPGQDA